MFMSNEGNENLFYTFLLVRCFHISVLVGTFPKAREGSSSCMPSLAAAEATAQQQQN